jgi:hypothetical protein
VNARGRIVDALREFAVEDGSLQDYTAAADAVLTVLPDLLTDHEVIMTVHERTTHTIRHVTVILTAAAKALTEGDTR